MIKVLWISPTFNHYKARFLDHLAMEQGIELTVLAGTGREGKGDAKITGQWSFTLLSCEVSKSHFGFSKIVRVKLSEVFELYDWILIPAEKKNLLLLVYAARLRASGLSRGKRIRLVSYNHAGFKNKDGKTAVITKLIAKCLYNVYDRVIFYTQGSCEWAITQKIVPKRKAYWVNNTIDDVEVKKYYIFQYPPINDIRILFIGRLIPSKRIDLLFDYYKALKNRLEKSNKTLKLEIIGDGPQRNVVLFHADKEKDIIWHGTLIDEKEIAPIMTRCSYVFVPGHSGLSINHAFCYGRPYVTIISQFHAPEIEYLENNKNGVLLSGRLETDIQMLFEFMTDQNTLRHLCNNAYVKSKHLSVNNWVGQMKAALNA